MATLRSNLVEKVNNEKTNSAESQSGDTVKGADQSEQKSAQDRSHSTSIMDTGKAL